ncbi:MAG TPA: hypothetical protein VMJ93_07940 [Verrucomicrobiae bacterium]|nr:hypothetical protein [Verrucomicrobiae bacterium]
MAHLFLDSRFNKKVIYGPHRTAKWLLVVCQIIWILPTNSTAGQARNAAYSRVVTVDHVMYRKGNRCAAFASFIRSDDFFEGLQAAETAAGRTFHRQGEAVTVFPDTLFIDIDSSLSDCSTFPPIPAAEADSEAFIAGLTFKAWWKVGFKERPAKIIFIKEVQPPISALSESEPASPISTLTLKVDSRGVPLTDHLVIEIYSKDGTFLCRMAGHL